MASAGSSNQFLVRIGAVVGLCSILLTASFVGMFALVSGQVVGVGNRVPYYLIVMAAAFVGTIVLLEEHRTDGRLIMVTTIVISTVTLVVVVMGAEGIIFTLREPQAVFNSQLLYYLLAAGLIATGLGYWSLNHWREFTRDGARGNL